MRFTSLFSSLAVIPAALAHMRMSPIEGYEVVDMITSVELNGEVHNLTGTVQEVVAQLQVLDPTFVLPTESVSVVERFPDILESRVNTLCCPIANYGWTGASDYSIQIGMGYLYNLNADCVVAARSCARISCGYNGGIYWCNDTYDTFVQGSRWLRQHVLTIIADCGKPDDKICGQNFDAGGYNIIVHSDSC